MPRVSRQSNSNQNALVPSLSDLNLEQKGHSPNSVSCEAQAKGVVTASASFGHCCKKQMAANGGGTEHDEKCNLYKAQQMHMKKQVEADSTAPKSTAKIVKESSSITNLALMVS